MVPVLFNGITLWEVKAQIRQYIAAAKNDKTWVKSRQKHYPIHEITSLDHSRLAKDRNEMRYIHVAYSMARGRSVDQVEYNSKTPLDMEKVSSYIGMIAPRTKPEALTTSVQ